MRHLPAMAAALALALFTFQTAGAHGFKAGKLEIGHPNTRAMLPGAKVAGGYVAVTNTGAAPDRLLGIEEQVEASEVAMQVTSFGVLTWLVLLAVAAGAVTLL